MFTLNYNYINYCILLCAYQLTIFVTFFWITFTIVFIPTDTNIPIENNYGITVTEKGSHDSHLKHFIPTHTTKGQTHNNDQLVYVRWSPPSCIPVHHLYTISITNDTITVHDNTTGLYFTISVSPCSSNYTVTVTVIDVGFTQYQSIPTSESEEKNNTQGNNNSIP